MDNKCPENSNCYSTIGPSVSEERVQKCIEMEMQNIDAIFSKQLSNNEVKDPDFQKEFCNNKETTLICSSRSSTTSLELIEEKRKLSNQLAAIDETMLAQCKALQAIAIELEQSKQTEMKRISETGCTIAKSRMDYSVCHQDNKGDCGVNNTDITVAKERPKEIMQSNDGSDSECYNSGYDEEFYMTGSSFDVGQDFGNGEGTRGDCNDFSDNRTDVSDRRSEDCNSEVINETQGEQQNGCRIDGGRDIMSSTPRNTGVPIHFDELEVSSSAAEALPCPQNFLVYDENGSQEFDWQEDDWQEHDWENLFYQSMSRSDRIPIRPKSS